MVREKLMEDAEPPFSYLKRFCLLNGTAQSQQNHRSERMQSRREHE